MGIISLAAVVFPLPLFVPAGPSCGPPCYVDASLQGFPAAKAGPLHGLINRFGTVDEIAHAALFLASPESRYITGITLPAEGGAVAGGATWLKNIAA